MLNRFYVKQLFSSVVAVSMLATTPLVFAETSASTASYAANTNSSGMTSISDSSTSASSMSSHTIPVGTSLLLKPISSIPTNVGDTFTAQLINPITATDGVSALPAGSQVKGEVTAINTNLNTVDVKFREVSTTTGVSVPISSHATISTLQSGVQSQVATSSTTTNGTVNSTYSNNGYTFFPTVSFGKSHVSPVAKVAAGTVGGAVLGATTGALTGVITKAVYSGSLRGNQGTWAIRDGLWGAALGGAIGLTAGVITAVATRNNSNVTTTTGSVPPTSTRPVTNVSTGSLEEIPTSYNGTNGTPSNPDFTIILDRPAYVSQS